MNIEQKKQHFINHYTSGKVLYESGAYEKAAEGNIDNLKLTNWKEDDDSFLANLMIGVPEVIDHLGLKEKVDKYMEETKERRHAYFEKQYRLLALSDDTKYLKEKWYEIIGNLQ